ncbi:MAG TPA: hypothetical protein VKF38_04820 [Anaerolineaceae bacterium]|nr:hypothetical protein [Anaerolineaceae bacterium]
MGQNLSCGQIQLRIASFFTCITGILFIGLMLVGCASTERPAALPPTPIILKTSEIEFPTAWATSIPFERTPTVYSEKFPTPVPEQASLQEKRLLSIEWPSSIRVGDSDIIRLMLEVDMQGQITPTVEVSGHKILGRKISIPDLYDADNIFAEARLDMAGMQVSPDGAVRQTMLPGQTLIFYWSISPNQAGTYRGTLWVYLDLVPKSGGEMDQRTLLAYRIDIQSNTVLGLSATTARWFGAGGAVFSSILGFPFLEKILERLWKRLHKEK